MPRKPKSPTSEAPLAPIPSEILDQFVGQGPLTPEELDAVVRRFKKAIIERALGGEPLAVDLEGDVYRLGLRSRMPEQQLTDLTSRILAAREDFRERLSKSQAEHYVEAFDPDRYIVNASVKENLV